MRDVYTRGLVTGDFILVHGDLVSNIQIDEVVKVHKERRKTNKDAIMTIVVKEAGVEHRTRHVFGVLAMSDGPRDRHTLMTMDTDRRATRLSSLLIVRPPSACTMNRSLGIRKRKLQASLGRCLMNIKRSKSDLTCWTVVSMFAHSRCVLDALHSGTADHFLLGPIPLPRQL